MLILMRRPSEEIFIGDNIKLMVTRVEGKNVYIGIDAPREINIIRGEKRGTRPGDTTKVAVKENKKKGSMSVVLEKAITTISEEVAPSSGQ